MIFGMKVDVLKGVNPRRQLKIKKITKEMDISAKSEVIDSCLWLRTPSKDCAT